MTEPGHFLQRIWMLHIALPADCLVAQTPPLRCGFLYVHQVKTTLAGVIPLTHVTDCAAGVRWPGLEIASELTARPNAGKG